MRRIMDYWHKLNKSGKVEQSVLISLLLAITIGVVVLLAIVYPVYGASNTSTGDGLCHFNTALRNAMPKGTKVAIPLLLCGEKSAKIYANDYSKCPAQYKGDAKNCGAYQIAVLADRCLYRGGGKDSYLGIMTSEYDICFKDVKVTNMGEGQKIKEQDLKRVVGETQSQLPHKLTKEDVNFKASGNFGDIVDIGINTPFKIRFIDDNNNYICIGNNICVL